MTHNADSLAAALFAFLAHLPQQNPEETLANFVAEMNGQQQDYQVIFSATAVPHSLPIPHPHHPDACLQLVPQTAEPNTAVAHTLHNSIHLFALLHTAPAPPSATPQNPDDLFDIMPIALWIEDYSQVKNYLDTLNITDHTELAAYFSHNPHAVAQCAALIKIVDANTAAVEQIGAISKEAAIAQVVPRLLGQEANLPAMTLELLALASGKTNYITERSIFNLDGEMHSSNINIKIATGYEQTWGKVLVSVVDITRYKRIEEALRESEERFRRFSDLAQEGILFNQSGIILDCNQRVAEMFGYEISDLLGQPVLDLAASSETDTLRHHLALNADEQYETIGRRRDGSLFPLEVRVRNILYNGRPTRVSVLRDITERKEAERILQKSEERFKALIESSFDGILLFDEQAVIQYASPSVRQITGYTPAELVNVSSLHFIPREYWREAADNFSQLLEISHEQMTYDQCLRHKDGRLIWVEATVKNLLHNPNVQAIVANFHDITDRKLAEDHLRASEERLRSIIEQSGDGILLVDNDNRVVVWNHAMETLSGLTQAQVLGQPATHIMAPLLPAANISGQLWPPPTLNLSHNLTEMVICATNGRERLVQLRTFPIQTETQQMSGSIFRDITEQRAHENQIRQQDNLAAMGQLASGIAHDFNNILAVILLYTQMLLRTKDLSDKSQTILQTMEHQARLAGELIEQILDFSRRTVLDQELLDVRPLLMELARLWQHTLPSNIQIQLTAVDKPCLIKTDTTRLQQMLTNLIVNARDAMPDGGILHIQLDHLPTTAVSLTQTDAPPPPHGWICIRIQDSGAGISPDIMPHLFEPFFTTKRRGKGTGLGLAQVYGIVKQHDGHIDVQSTLGGGTTFNIYLPALPASTELAPPSTQAAIPHGRQQTILLVEDEPDLRHAIHQNLELLKYKIILAAQGEEALALYHIYNEQIDLILSDIVMPKMDGIKLLQAIRQVNPTLPFILMTGHPLQEELQNTIQPLNLTSFFLKPVTLEKLAQYLADALLN
jgi:PAS domain S-box-containing protein